MLPLARLLRLAPLAAALVVTAGLCSAALAQVHRNERANYAIQIPAGWQAVAQDQVDFAMTDARSGMRLEVRVIEGTFGPDKDAFRVLTEHRKDDLDYLLVRTGPKSIDHVRREGWYFLHRWVREPKVDMTVVVPQHPNGESAIYYLVRLEGPARRIDGFEDEMSRILQGFRIEGEPAQIPVTRTGRIAPELPSVQGRQSREAAVSLPGRFEDQGLGYLVRHPAGWSTVRLNPYTVRFTTGRNASGHEAAVTIQNMAGRAAGGAYATAEEVSAVFQRQIIRIDAQAKFQADRPFIYDRTRIRVKGLQFFVEFDADGVRWRQWQIIVPRPDRSQFHAWTFAAPVARFNRDAPVAAAMLDSWTIFP